MLVILSTRALKTKIKNNPTKQSPHSTPHILKVPSTNPLPHPALVEVVHQLHESRLRLLSSHGAPLYLADRLLRRFLLRVRQAVDVV